jgi:hypothetical protein
MDILPALKPGRITAAFGASAFLPALLAELSLRGPVTVLDGGNRFPAYRIAREIRKRSLDVLEASNRIHLRRAFTAYQVVHLLESAPAVRHPQVLLDLPAAFQDDQITPREAERLLTLCLLHLERLSHGAPLLLCLEPFIAADKAFVLERLSERADKIFSITEPAITHPTQLPLFP